MRRVLVVANQTLDSPELMELVRDRLSEGPTVFHLLVPEHVGGGLVWDEGQVHNESERRLDDARLRFVTEGIAVSGEVGQANPVFCVEKVLRRDGMDHYDEIIVSTLPARVSRWLRADAPTRIRRMTTSPVTHLEAVIAHT